MVKEMRKPLLVTFRLPLAEFQKLAQTALRAHFEVADIEYTVVDFKRDRELIGLDLSDKYQDQLADNPDQEIMAIEKNIDCDDDPVAVGELALDLITGCDTRTFDVSWAHRMLEITVTYEHWVARKEFFLRTLLCHDCGGEWVPTGNVEECPWCGGHLFIYSDEVSDCPPADQPLNQP